MDFKKAQKLAIQIAKHRKSGGSVETLSIDMKTLQSVGKAIGLDVSDDLGAMIAGIVGWVDELTSAMSGQAPPPATEEVAVMSEVAEEEGIKEQLARAKAQLTILQREQKERDTLAKNERDRLQVVALHAENVRRIELCKGLVRNGLYPALVWADDAATLVKEPFASMDIVELEKLSKGSGASVATKPVNVIEASEGVSSLCEITEYESKRVSVAARKAGVDPDVALSRYVEEKEKIVRGAKTSERKIYLGRGINQKNVLADETGRVNLAAVKPIEQFSGSSQRMLEEFRTDCMVQIAVMPSDWVSVIGSVLSSGSLRTTFPLDFSAVSYKERTAQTVAAETPQTTDITIDKKEFRAAAMADVRRVREGDFAYLYTWLQKPAQFARGRMKLRQHQIKTLLEAGVSTAWVDGANFFSATHKVHPFNPKMKMLGSATWSNYQASASPLSASTLTEQKAAMLAVPYFDGEQLETRASGLLVPTSLDETAKNLLTVQDLIMEYAGTLGVVGVASAGVRNEHFNSGFKHTWASQLTGSGVTADYFLYSEGTIAMGYMPWVVAEDAAEELLEWDEDTDFYRDTGLIKIESKIHTNAALIWPHGIRLVKGT